MTKTKSMISSIFSLEDPASRLEKQQDTLFNSLRESQRKQQVRDYSIGSAKEKDVQLATKKRDGSNNPIY